MAGDRGDPRALDWGVAGAPYPGEMESGDLHAVLPHSAGCLVAVVDALGHGPEAAASARAAVASLSRSPADSVTEQLLHCHSALSGIRGAVMSLAAIDATAGSMTWIGVGNVDGYVFSTRPDGNPSRKTLVAPGGIVGSALPPLRASTIPIAKGDLVIFATDGVRSDFFDELSREGPPQQIADEVLKRGVKGTDDALVLVVRYLGP